MNIRDIARIAGVSTSTVSKIVNGKDSSISEETRKKVLTIVKEYHYKPYASASQRTRSYTIGVLLRSPISFDSTLDGIIQAAQNAGYATDAYNSYSDPERELKNIAAICGRNVDGVIWEPATPDSLAYASQFPESTPLLTIGPNGGDQSLLLPYKEAAYKLTSELIERGHQHIACLMTKGRRTQDFLEGFRSCLFDHQLPYSDDLVYYDLNDSLPGKIGSRDITGFVSSHYRRALEFTQMISPLHYRLPRGCFTCLHQKRHRRSAGLSRQHGNIYLHHPQLRLRRLPLREAHCADRARQRAASLVRTGFSSRQHQHHRSPAHFRHQTCVGRRQHQY